MAEPFDPAEFDAPPSGDPHADYRTLLDAMRRAGAEGIAEEVGALARQIEQEARQRADWGRTVGSRSATSNGPQGRSSGPVRPCGGTGSRNGSTPP